jgi:hypothetical protein
MNFYSEYGEDAVLYGLFPSAFNIPHFYVDVGCGNPNINSNTAFLRELGWQGMHIDGNKDWEKDWPPGSFIHAVISTHSSVHFDPNPVRELSRITNAEPNQGAVTLESLLQMHGVDKIGLLSVDCEGHEYEVIRSMNLELHQPQFIIGEYNTLGIGEDYRVMEYLTLNGYEVVHQTIANLCYVRSTPDGP